MTTYIDAIGIGFPTVNCTCLGNGAIYADLRWVSGSPLPTQSDLDTWILSHAKDVTWDKIKIERTRRQAGGVKVGTDWFNSDSESRIQQLGLVMFGANLPANLMWKTMAGTFVTMTQTLASQIFQATASSDVAIFTIAETHKAYMLASVDPASYNYLTGWPLIYGE